MMYTGSYFIVVKVSSFRNVANRRTDRESNGRDHTTFTVGEGNAYSLSWSIESLIVT